MIEEPNDNDMDQPKPRRSTSIQRRPDLRRISDAPFNRSKPLSEPESKRYTPVPPVEEEEDPLAATEIADRAKMNKARKADEFEQEQEEVISPPPASGSSHKKREKPAAASRRPSPPQDDPFAVVVEDPFAVQEEPPQEEQDASEDDDAVFVFGNPFEGPLPDVFMEDEDLKRSVLEQQANLTDDPSAKKDGKKATGIRKRSSS
jgi:hypothetical protein